MTYVPTWSSHRISSGWFGGDPSHQCALAVRPLDKLAPAPSAATAAAAPAAAPRGFFSFSFSLDKDASAKATAFDAKQRALLDKISRYLSGVQTLVGVRAGRP